MTDDREIVRQVLDGKTNAFEAIILKYQQPLFNYIGRMVGDRETALDLTQEVFLKAFASLHTYKASYSFRPWLFRIASHLLIDLWRKKKLPLASLDQTAGEDPASYSLTNPSGAMSVTTRYELHELIQRLEQALQKIPAQLRELFLFRYVNGLSYAEIAEITDLPVGTLKNRVFQAKERLRSLLEEQL